MFNPCFEHCYVRYNKEYTAHCDATCAYAKAVKDRDKAIDWLLGMLEDEHMGMRANVAKTLKETYDIEV